MKTVLAFFSGKQKDTGESNFRENSMQLIMVLGVKVNRIFGNGHHQTNILSSHDHRI